MKKVLTAVCVAVIGMACMAFGHNLTPADYQAQEVGSYGIETRTQITEQDLGLLDIVFSVNQMLAWQATLAEAPITTWEQAASLTYYAFDDEGNPKKPRKLITTGKETFLRLFFTLKSEASS